MKMNKWMNDLRKQKRAIPILSFPAIQLLNCTLDEFLHSSELQCQGMQLVSERCQMGIGIGMMDLSLEAECFGSPISFHDNQIPTVKKAIVEDDASHLEVPQISKRAYIYIDAIKMFKEKTNKPVFPGMIGPFSLAGRLLDVNEALALCYEDEDLVLEVLEKVTEFLILYGKELKKAGANGLIMAEPLAGILSPQLVEQFSCQFVSKIVKELQDEEFIIIYHNCGNNVDKMIEPILSTQCSIYHFGNAINMKNMLEKIPRDIIVMGNIDPVGVLRDGSLSLIEEKTKTLLEECQEYDNFIISSGCDIPHDTKWENIDKFITCAKEYYEKENNIRLFTR